MSQSLVGAAPPPTEPPASAVAEGTAARKIEGRSPWRLGMERLVRDRAAMISLGVIVLIVLHGDLRAGDRRDHRARAE